jgi:hypothetical protein
LGRSGNDKFQSAIPIFTCRGKGKPNELAEAKTFLTYISVMFSSNLGVATLYPELRSSQFSLDIPCNCRNNASNDVSAACFHSLLNTLFTNQPALARYMV